MESRLLDYRRSLALARGPTCGAKLDLAKILACVEKPRRAEVSGSVEIVDEGSTGLTQALAEHEHQFHQNLCTQPRLFIDDAG